MMIAMAVKAWVPGTVIVGNAGVTAMDLIPLTESTAGDDVMLPTVAVMFVVPTATPVATPPEVTVATLVLEDAQVVPEADVTSFDDPSLYVAVAVNDCCCPTPIEGVLGATTIFCKVTFTVSTAGGDVMPLNDAVILVVPAATPEATPPEVIVATVVLEEVQVTPVAEVRSFEAPSV
jgi:hypothetical protein